jgi:hypothetical protein
MYSATRHVPYLEIAQSAGSFISDELASDLPTDAFCIRYFPGTNSTVHNASLLGAAFLARLQSFTGKDFTSTTLKAADFSLSRQRADGSWPYGEGPSQTWVDSFHSGYNLLALREIGRHLTVSGLPDAIDRGYSFYRHHFFRDDGAVRYNHDRDYPVDAHAVGHALLTLADFSDRDPTALNQASKCIDWATKHLWAPSGYFYYQRHRWLTNRIPYIRWSQAWMLIGLVAILERNRKTGGSH